jgi:hypothetical protein
MGLAAAGRASRRGDKCRDEGNNLQQGLSVDGPDALVNQPFVKGDSHQELFAHKIAKIPIGLAKVAGSFTKLSGKANLFKGGVHELPRAFHGRFQFLRHYRVLAGFRDGLHMSSEHKVIRGGESS